MACHSGACTTFGLAADTSFSSCLNSGESSTLSWMYMTIGTSSAVAQKGIRQPHDTKAASSTADETMTKARLPSRAPVGTPTCMNEPENARCLGPADSLSSSASPPHWAPQAMPWMNRHVTSRTGAMRPMLPAEGRQPMRKVKTAMPSRAMTTMGLRPILSPKLPATRPPTGRAMKPVAKVENARSVPVTPLVSGKKTCGKTSAAAVP